MSTSGAWSTFEVAAVGVADPWQPARAHIMTANASGVGISPFAK